MPDPRWDEADGLISTPVIAEVARRRDALKLAIFEELRRQEANDDEVSVAGYVATAVIIHLSDAGLYLTPQMAEVLEAAKAWREWRSDANTPADRWAGNNRLLAAVDALSDAKEATKS